MKVLRPPVFKLMRQLAATNVVMALSLVLGSFAAHADILFIDTDNAPEEIRAATEAAKARHERLVVVPSRDLPEEQEALFAIGQLEFKKTKAMEPATLLWKNYDVLHALYMTEQAKTPPDQKRINQLLVQEGAALAIFNKKFKELLQTKAAPIVAEEKKIPFLPKFTLPNLKQVLEEEQLQRRVFTAVIISGHHGNGEFHGVLGNANRDDVYKTFVDYPVLLNSVRSIFGWGCYTVNIDNEDWWTSTWPHVELLAGFEGGGPSSTNDSSHALMKELLAKDASIRAESALIKPEQQTPQLGREIKALPDFMEMNSAVATKHIYVGKSSGIINLSNIAKTCTPEALSSLQKTLPRFQAVLSGMEAPPCETAVSWLRTYYDQLRLYVHCPRIENPLKAQFAPFAGLADKAVKTIFWAQVTSNTFFYYGKDLDAAIEYLNRSGIATPELSLPRACEPTAPGAGVLSFKDISALQANVCATVPLHPEFTKACSALKMLQNLSPCLPFSWVEPPEPDGSIEPPLCEE